jgi:hypothetical protein
MRAETRNSIVTIMTAATHHTHQEASDRTAEISVCDTVLNTTELAERIIVHLPAKHIFVIQRVCKTFANVITTSPSIQEKIFKRLRGQLEVDPPEPTVHSTTVQDATGRASGPPSRPTLSPWLAFQLNKRSLEKIDSPYGAAVELKYGRLFREHLVIEKHNSYLDTYFCDPPCRFIRVRQKYLVHDVILESSQVIEADKALTVYEVLTMASARSRWTSDAQFFEGPSSMPRTLRGAIKLCERAGSCTDGPKTVLTAARFMLYGVFDPEIMEPSTACSGLGTPSSVAVTYKGGLWDKFDSE